MPSIFHAVVVHEVRAAERSVGFDDADGRARRGALVRVVVLRLRRGNPSQMAYSRATSTYIRQ